MRLRAKQKKTARGLTGSVLTAKTGRGAFLPLLLRKAPAYIPPIGLFALYVVAARFSVFSPLYLLFHLAAGVTVALWIWRVWQGDHRYWAYGTHGRYAMLFLAFVIVGSSWGPFRPEDVRVWISPPSYTARPTIQMTQEVADIVGGSVIHVGLKTDKPVEILWDGTAETLTPELDEESTLSFPVPAQGREHSADLIVRRGWQRLGLWRAQVVPDRAPQIVWTETPELTSRKTLRLAYDATDDFGVESVLVRVAPVEIKDGEPAAPVELPLAAPRMPKVRGASYADLTSLPWAGQTVVVQLVAEDGAHQRTLTVGKTVKLPQRHFRNPFARALIEEREKLLREPGAAARSEAANIMAGIARQQGLFRSDAALYLALRAGAVRLVLDHSALAVDTAAHTLWESALNLEEGMMGESREVLAQTLQDLAQAVARGAAMPQLDAVMRALKASAQIYYASLENERAKQPDALREMNWLPIDAGQPVVEEDYIARIDAVSDLLTQGREDSAVVRLNELQKLTENLRTVAPELNPTQDRLAQQVSSLRALVRGQKQVNDETEALLSLPTKTAQDKKDRGQAIARSLARQQALLGALQGLIEQFPEARSEIKDGVRAMLAAVNALHNQKPDEARRQQAEAQALLENSTLLLSEKMRQSMTAAGP